MTDATTAGLSFNEIEALGTKAARGAGLGWGHAEDLGRAARWFAEHGFDWAERLLRLLDREDASSRMTALVQASDRATAARAGDTWSFDDDHADWIVPLLAASIHGRDIGIEVRWPGAVIVLAPDGSASTGAGLVDLDAPVRPLSIEAITRAPSSLRKLATRSRPAAVSTADLARLATSAARTSVPASDASRARGAGGGRSDND